MFEMLEAPGESSPQQLAPEDLIEELESLFTHRDRYDARIATVLKQIEETEAFRRDGYTSSTAMLKHRMSLHPGEALRYVTRANGLTQAPLTAFAYPTGAISGAQVDVILEAKFVAGDAFPEAEGWIVTVAMDTPLVRDLKKQLEYWLEQVAPVDLGSERDLMRDLRSLILRRDGEMIRINGWVDIEAGERLRAGLELGPPAEGDTRSTPARRADLLLDIMNGASGRPDILVHVAADTLLEGRPGISETSSGTFLTTEEIRRLACDANLTRVVFDPESQPLDVGRTKRLVTGPLRTAVWARDLRCVFTNCDRDANWCDVHHLVHWANGGETTVDNLVLLCRTHHVLVHEAGWTITGQPGDLHFHRPDGTELGAQPPPRPPTRSPIFTVETKRELPPGGLLPMILSRQRVRAP
jgi:hypothetical protein